MIIVAPEAAGELRDRGYVYQRLECWRPALQDLTEYLEREPDAADLDEVRARDGGAVAALRAPQLRDWFPGRGIQG